MSRRDAVRVSPRRPAGLLLSFPARQMWTPVSPLAPESQGRAALSSAWLLSNRVSFPPVSLRAAAVVLRPLAELRARFLSLPAAPFDPWKAWVRSRGLAKENKRPNIPVAAA